MITDEEAVALLMTFGKSEAQARKLLSSRAGASYRGLMASYAMKIKAEANDPTIDVVEYLSNKGKNNKKGRN